MSAKANAAKMFEEIASLERAIADAKAARGQDVVTIINDPEDGLEAFRIPNLDQSKTLELGPAEFPGDEWYEAYAAASKAGDTKRSWELLTRGAAVDRRREAFSPRPRRACVFITTTVDISIFI
jgi:hypothetical protein